MPLATSPCNKERTGIILIGMPGAGKSTLGRRLSAQLGKAFVDTDDLLEQHLGCALQPWLNEHGYLALRAEEERAVLAHNYDNCVVATGGSVVYSDAAISHLKQFGVLVYLHATEQSLLQRIGDFSQRGITMRPGQTFHSLYLERSALYKQYAEHTISTDTQSQESLVERLSTLIGSAPKTPID